MSNYIFCVDSDGCAMDTMTYKHEKFFGPIAADKYDVEDRETFQKNWEDINLYTKTRGVNRFVGLVMGLESVDYKGVDNLKRWVDETSSLSNDSLEDEIEKVGSDDLKKALAWSEEVNKSVSEAEGFDKPFPGAKEGLKQLADNGTVYVVSSANKEAVESEWSRHGLLEYVEDLYCQDRGKKADVINQLIEQGNSPENIFMIGDSPGDLEAAEANNTWFYPIIVGEEEDSWKTLRDEVISQITADDFDQETQDKYTNAFWSNLEK